MPASIVFIPLGALLTLFVSFGLGRGRSLIAFALGLVGGLLFAVRLPNMLLLVGLFTAVLVNSGTRGANRRDLALAVTSGLCGFAITGAFPVLTANWINAGSPFATTYTGVDASPPVFQWASIEQRVQFYFTHSIIALVSAAAVFALVVRLLTARRYRPAAGRYGLSIGALACFGLSLAFFSTHDIVQPYYMLPASILTICLVVFEILLSRPIARPAGADQIFTGVGLACLILLAAWRIHNLAASQSAAELPTQVTGPAAIVWADISSGTAYYYDHKFAAKINFADRCLGDRIVYQVSKRGRDQYFVDDSDEMKATIARLARIAPLQPIGVFRTYQTLPIFKLSADGVWSGAPCSEL
jgi:hypothetical protein